jgi:hypothetical protein
MIDLSAPFSKELFNNMIEGLRIVYSWEAYLEGQ